MEARQGPITAGGRFQRRTSAVAVALALGVLLTACGGGGGGGGEDTAGGGTDQPAANPPTNTEPSAPGRNAEAMDFTASTAQAAEGALDTLYGGDVYAAWSPRNVAEMMAPGMKVTFFGRGEGCTGEHAGPVVEGDLATAAPLSALTGVALDGRDGLRWMPASDDSMCEDADLLGDSMVFLNAESSTAALALLTHTGPGTGGASGFFQPYTASGQADSGANAHISGTFVAFRQAWRSEDPLQPFADGPARLYTVQSVHDWYRGSNVPASAPIQTQQQMLATFINRDCFDGGYTAAAKCQVQYLFTTAIARTGVTDWSQVSWFGDAKIWFDPAQGNLPIVSGPIGVAGETTRDRDDDLALYTSRANATQHAKFSAKAFDVRISFAQLKNVLKAVAARHADVDAADVTSAQMVDAWGTTWDQPSAWLLLSSSVAQEVYNPHDDAQRAYVGGSVTRLYVGPAQ